MIAATLALMFLPILPPEESRGMQDGATIVVAPHELADCEALVADLIGTAPVADATADVAAMPEAPIRCVVE
ncbi:hypothetical protein [Wenxinia saemankumensis]|uniref:Uncharacterized protein n=1 Tax=Wenxinia saemankumensis TaxID=1447782 RepID=A0A1M6GZZ7_9RHOB|nr:hypothetical protein [Wenxinia saemankumensis]SHJ15474.1 hypothetical protein SAMN05444417_3026 [Wenxinia saemankumensis]